MQVQLMLFHSSFECFWLRDWIWGFWGLGPAFVYLIPCWVVVLSDRYMYKLPEPWEDHRSCCRFPSCTVQPAPHTPLMNANGAYSFFFIHALHISTFLYSPLKRTPLVSCERVHVSSAQWVSEVNSPESCLRAKLDTELTSLSASCLSFWLFPVVLRPHSNSLRTTVE